MWTLAECNFSVHGVHGVMGGTQCDLLSGSLGVNLWPSVNVPVSASMSSACVSVCRLYNASCEVQLPMQMGPVLCCTLDNVPLIRSDMLPAGCAGISPDKARFQNVIFLSLFFLLMNFLLFEYFLCFLALQCPTVYWNVVLKESGLTFIQLQTRQHKM